MRSLIVVLGILCVGVASAQERVAPTHGDGSREEVSSGRPRSSDDKIPSFPYAGILHVDPATGNASLEVNSMMRPKKLVFVEGTKPADLPAFDGKAIELVASPGEAGVLTVERLHLFRETPRIVKEGLVEIGFGPMQLKNGNESVSVVIPRALIPQLDARGWKGKFKGVIGRGAPWSPSADVSKGTSPYFLVEELP